MTDELLIKYLLKETNAKEQNLIEEWLKESKENQKQFDQIRFLWEKSGDLLRNETQPDEEEAWERFKEKRAGQVVTRNIRPWNVFQLLAAASVVIITGITLWLFFTKDLSSRNIIAKNEIISSKLSDGSLLTINKNSQLSFRASASERLVKLAEGEVFFKVTPDKTKPFVIELGDAAKVTVLGTSFNIKYRKGIAEVIVETGLVRVSKNSAELHLRPGEKVEFDDQDSVLHATKNNDSLYKYFRNKEFVIDNVPLQKVINVLSEAYSTKIILADEDLADLKLNVKFKEEPLDKILGIISETFGLKVLKEKDRYILQKK